MVLSENIYFVGSRCILSRIIFPIIEKCIYTRDKIWSNHSKDDYKIVLGLFFTISYLL